MSPEDHAEELAKEVAGNWAKFESFAWHDKPEDCENWGICYTSNRDTEDALTLSNEEVINEELEKFEDDVCFERHNHWGVGYVNGFSIRVYKNGEITEAFKKYCKLMLAISDYPVLDESRCSEKQLEKQYEDIRFFGRVNDDAPEDWHHEVWEWIRDNEPESMEEEEYVGKAVERAIEALGYDDDD